MSIFPYIYYMIKDFNITDDPSKISVFAGMVTSAFTLAEFATGVMWGRLSDKIGRKPVLLFGLLGTAISVLIFGFAPSLPVALFARALGGLLNGYGSPSLHHRLHAMVSKITHSNPSLTEILAFCKPLWRS